MKNKKNIKVFVLTIIILLAGCEKDWLDINHDPNSPSTAAINQLLPGIMYDIAADFSYGYCNLGYSTACYTHQLCTREVFGTDYSMAGSDYNISTFWQDFYSGPLQDLELMINLGTDDGNILYVGIAKILKAYIFSITVDLWGDIPFSEANISGITNPVFDDDAVIYPQLITLIDEGITDLNDTEAENIISPGDDDLIYNGDITKWLHAANTIKLKLYLQSRETSMWDEAAVNALLGDGSSLIGGGEDFMVPFGSSRNPDNRNPGFIDEYVGNQISSYISPWFYELLKGDNPDIFTGIGDPRIPYYFCNQITDGVTENPSEYQDGNFVSIYFGSVGINRDHAGRSTFTMVGMYPVGGKFDDGTGGGPFSGNDGTGAAPQRLLTYANRLFIEAELAHYGLTVPSGDERTVLEAAINAAFAQVDMVVGMTGTTQTVPDLVGDPTVINYITAVMAEYDAASTEKQLEIILTQKWISSFGNSIDQYTDYRRTGCPVMFDPEIHPSDGGPDGNGAVPTQRLREYILSFPWDDDELTLNENAPEQKLIASYRVFWDIN